MSQFRKLKMFWQHHKLKSVPSTRNKGGSAREDEVNNVNVLNVKEEYMNAFRTKSYIDIYSKVQIQLRGISTTTTTNSTATKNSVDAIQFSDFLLEPNQEILISMIKSLDLPYLLVDYFEASLEACRICEFLLRCIDQTRANYCIIQRVMKLSRRMQPAAAAGFESSDVNLDRILFKELATFAKLDNPLSVSNQLQFNTIHDRYGSMLDRLRMKRKKIGRRMKVISFCKKAFEASLILACGGLAIVTVVLALHCVVGLVVAPAGFLAACKLGLFRRKLRSVKDGLKRSRLSAFYAQLDAASKGVYTLNKDFDTMSRLVIRLHNEIEHTKSIAELCVKNRKRQMLKEVVKEFKNQDSCFLEKLGELEEHVYLCVLTINRARRLVIQETMEHINKTVHNYTFEDSNRDGVDRYGGQQC